MTAWGKIAHNYLAFPFMLGLVIMFLIWIKDNIPAGSTCSGSSKAAAC